MFRDEFVAGDRANLAQARARARELVCGGDVGRKVFRDQVERERFVLAVGGRDRIESHGRVADSVVSAGREGRAYL